MIVYLNGRFLPEQQACVSIFDRGFLYGDALFETLRVYSGEPFLWDEHLERFRSGCEALGLVAPLSAREMRTAVTHLLIRNELAEALVRITLSRGSGPRGYSPGGADHPTFVISAFAAPKPASSYKVVTASIRLPTNDPLAVFKHANKLRQVLARSEADQAGADEALLSNERDEVVEGTSTNLFWFDSETLCTPPLDGILAGTARNHVLRLAAHLRIKTQEQSINVTELILKEGVFLTSSAIEIVEVSHINEQPIVVSPHTRRLQRAYRSHL